MYWAALEGSVVKIHKFKGVKKHEKRNKERLRRQSSSMVGNMRAFVIGLVLNGA
jgi:hypothetical protein